MTGARSPLVVLLAVALSAAPSPALAQPASTPRPFVRVSARDAHHLELADGRLFVPIGLNLIAPDTPDSEGLARIDEWLGKVAASGGDYARKHLRWAMRLPRLVVGVASLGLARSPWADSR